MWSYYIFSMGVCFPLTLRFTLYPFLLLHGLQKREAKLEAKKSDVAKKTDVKVNCVKM